jgi:DNA-binding response OmpR family regulator
VDDDSAFRALFTTALRFAGFDVQLAADGLAALRQIEQLLPDAVVLDLDLPFVNGLVVHEELVARSGTRRVPVIIVTGTDWESSVATLRKPVDPADLIPILRKAVIQA